MRSDAGRRRPRRAAARPRRGPHGVAGDPGADARPEAGLLAAARPARGTGARRRPPDDQQQRGQEGGLGEQGRDDADGADRAEAVQRGRLRGQEADHGAGDRAGGGEQGRQGAAQRGRHRVLGGGVAAQLFPVTVDKQQRVVAGGAEDQHDQDLGRQRADGEPGVGQAVGGGLGDLDGRRARRTGETTTAGGCGRRARMTATMISAVSSRGSLVPGAAVGVHRGRPGHGGLQAGGRRLRARDHAADGSHRGAVDAGLSWPAR